MKTRLLCTLLAAQLLMISCQNKIADLGTGSTTETAVTAMLYNPGGSPAKNATVYFVPRNYQPSTGSSSTLATIDSVYTDIHGNYSTQLEPGDYTISAKGDSGLAYQDSITAIKGTTVKPPADTLKPAGTLRGRIELQPGHDARTVFILFLGTRNFSTPSDSIGNFITNQMAEGKYRVRIFSTIDDYYVMDTSLTITSGKDSVLPQPITLKYRGIPIPKNVTLKLDTLTQIVTLSWSKADTSLVKGYNVFRRDIDSSFSSIPLNGARLVTDTIFRDSNPSEGIRYEYKVLAIDKGDNVGRFSLGNSVSIVQTAFQYMGILEPPKSTFPHGVSLMAIKQDKFFYIGQYGNDSFKVLVYNSEGVFLKEYPTFDPKVMYPIAVGNAGQIYTSNWSSNEDTTRPHFSLFDSSGSKLADIGFWGNHSESTRYEMDAFTAVAPNGDFYILYRNLKRVQIFNAQGIFKREITNTTFDDFICLTNDRTGYQFESSRDNYKFRILDINGTIQKEWPCKGYFPCLTNTKNIAMIGLPTPSANSYHRSNILFYSQDGKLLAKFGHYGTGLARC